ncbi:MAG TPA: metallopeptidase TldD-related protein [Acidimicrobiales bacterium]
MTVNDVKPQDLVEQALSMSRADGCIVIADEITSANLRWANNTLTSNGISRAGALTVIAIVEGATGIVAQEGVTLDSLEDVVRAAETAASGSGKAEDRMPLAAADTVLSPGDWDAPPAETSIGVFADTAKALGHQFGRSEAEGELLFGFASHEVRTSYLASSTGLRARHDQPTGYVEMNAKSKDFARSAWAGVPSEDFTDVDILAISAGLSQRLDWAKRQLELPAGRYATILPPTAVADLMISMYWSLGARDAHDGRTVFSRPGGGTRVGDRLSDKPITLRSDPSAPSLMCSPVVFAHSSSAAQSVFDNGLPIHPTRWIADGNLQSLIQTRHSASLTGLPVTPYVDNLIMDGTTDGDDLRGMTEASSGRTLLLTCLWYIRTVDPQTLLLTGLTRDGVYLVEDGEVVGAVNNFRFNESPVDLLARVSSVGLSERTLPREWSDYFTRTAMPPLLVEDFNMSSVSQAS